MKVLIDTNIIVDMALIREPFFDNSDRILVFAEQENIQACVSAAHLAILTTFFARVEEKIGHYDFCVDW